MNKYEAWAKHIEEHRRLLYMEDKDKFGVGPGRNPDEKTDKEKFEAFTRELAVVINKHGVDNEMSVPDYILSTFIVNTMLSLKQTMGMMKDFYEASSDGRAPDLGDN